MRKKIVKYSSLFLVMVFLLPHEIKLFDTFFHNHEHFHCNAINEKHFHKLHKKCPIETYEFTSFLKKRKLDFKPFYKFFIIWTLGRESKVCISGLEYSFNRRGPPFC